jgi:hypothetical protein
MALDPSGTGRWYPTLPEQPPTSGCIFSEVAACTGAPDDASGVDGDVRIDLTTGDVYIKTNGTWVILGGSGLLNMSDVGSPVGAVVPNGINIWYRDTATDNYWWATGLTNADWTAVV